MNHTALMHGLDADLDNLQQYDGWLAQEKYRGVRLFWDGQHAWTRQGKPIALPAHYALPAGVALDCELYDGPGIPAERRCATAVRWGRFTDTMRVVVFDLPEHGGTAAERQAALAELNAFIAGHTVVSSVDHLRDLLERVLRQDGEGLMLRHPESRYVAGRSAELVKVKYAA